MRAGRTVASTPWTGRTRDVSAKFLWHRLGLVLLLVAESITTAAPAHGQSNRVLDLAPASLISASTSGLDLDGEALTLAPDAPAAQAYDPHPSFGTATSAVIPLSTPASVYGVTLDVDTPEDSMVNVEIRGQVGSNWTEWQNASGPTDGEVLGAIQVRTTLLAAQSRATPRLKSIHIQLDPSKRLREATLQSFGPPTARIWATREGLVGHTTANGHVIAEHDHFASLPSLRSLNSVGGSDYQVRISYRGRTTVVPIWDAGPWNVSDDYWNGTRELFHDLPRWTSEAESAFFNSYNSGKDGFGRTVTLPTSLDIADGTFWDDLGMTNNDWVDVTFLWLNAPSPPPRATPAVVPKTVPGGNPLVPHAPRAASYNLPSPALQVYLPLLMQNVSGWTTPWTLQNPSSQSVLVQADLTNSSGMRVGSLPITLPPWGSRTFAPTDVPGVTTGFLGSASVSASGPITAVVNEDRDGFNRASYAGLTSGASTLELPLVFKNYDGWSTGIQVQNLGSTSTIVRVSYAGSDRPGSDGAIIPPLTSATFYQPASGALPSSFVGSATVESLGGQPLAAVVNEVRTDGSATAYPGLIGGSDRFDAPLLFKKYDGWSTGIQLVNLARTPTIALISYVGDGSAEVADVAALPVGRAVSLYQPSQPLLPDGFVGSASIESSGGPLVGIVNEVKPGTQASMSYTLGGPGATSLAAPLVMKGYNGWDTGIEVQNEGDATTVVRVSFYREDGTMVLRVTDSLDIGGSQSYYPPALAALPDGFVGSAFIESISGEPLIGIVNQSTR